MSSKILKILSGVVLLTLLSKGLGFVREAMIASQYGAGFVSDVYVFEDGLLNMIYTICAGVIGTTFIPKFLSLADDEKNEFFSNFGNVFLIIITIISVVGIVFTQQLLRILVPGFYEIYSSDVMTELVFITRINLCSLVLVFLENYFVVVLQANKQYIFASLQGIVLNVFLCVYLIFLHRFGILGIIVAKILVHIVNIIIMWVVLSRQKVIKYSFCLNLKSQHLREVFKLAIPIIILGTVSQMNYLVDRTMASSLPEGSMAQLSYANTIGLLIYNVAGLALTSIAYPEISVYHNDEKMLSKTFCEYFKMLLNFIVPICIVMIVMRYDIVKVIYGRGMMDDNSVVTIAIILALYTPGNLFLCVRDLFNKLMYIKKNTKMPAIVTMCSFVMNIVLNIILVDKLGVYGLATATTISSVVATIIIVICCKFKGYLRSLNILNWTFYIKVLFAIIISYVYVSCVVPNNILTRIISIGVLLVVNMLIFNLNELKKMIGWKKKE